MSNLYRMVLVTSALVAALNGECLVAEVPLKAPRVVEPFPLDRVQVTGGPFLHAQELDIKYLWSLEPDRLLAWYRKEAGLAPNAEPYGGWEREQLAGHSLGHYLTACSLAYKTAADDELKKKVDYVVAELAEIQKANGNGYLGAIPKGKELWAEVKAGDIKQVGNFSLNGVWSPWYTMHKLFAGLIDAYRLCGNAQAMDVVTQYADWAVDTTSKLDDATIQKMLACEFGGMNESMTEMFALTGDERYLNAARRVFYHHALFDPIAAHEDKLAGIHSNTQVPKMIGLDRMYEVTGDSKYQDMAKFFWSTVVGHHTYANGGNSSSEYFGMPDKLSTRLGQTTETCNTYNMLKLTRDLFMHDPKASYFDYYERALWNHILAHQHPETGMFVYKGFLEPGAVKEFSKPFDDFWCCVGSGMENHVKYNDSIYFRSTKGDPTIYVNEFIPSAVNWAEESFKLTLETRLPLAEGVRIRVDVPQPKELTIKIRKPAWLSQPMAIMINGEPKEVKVGDDGYVTFKDTWQIGDRIEMLLPMGLRTEEMPDDPNMVAFFYGPILLCAEMGPAAAATPGADANASNNKGKLPPKLVVARDKLVSSFKAIPGTSLHFEAVGIGRADGSPQSLPANFGAKQDVELLPHYMVSDHRYSVYLSRLDPEGWSKYANVVETERKRIAMMEQRTLDAFVFGDTASERNHNLGRMISYSGESYGQQWRDARPGGFFEFDLAVLPNEPMELAATYRGSETSPHTFEILVDGKTIATQQLDTDTSAFRDVLYDIPAELTRGKQKVRVRFSPYQNSPAGNVYGKVRMLRKN